MSKRAAQHWLVKSEPYKYSFSQLQADGQTFWDGVRNYEARNHLRAMKKGDLVLFYHSNEGKEVVGTATVVREAYPDPTSDDDWSVVDLAPLAPLARPVSLAQMKRDPQLSQMELLRRSRLSVVPVRPEEYAHILKLGAASV